MNCSSLEVQHSANIVHILGSIGSRPQSHPVSSLICSQIRSRTESELKFFDSYPRHVGSEPLFIRTCIREDVNVDPSITVPLINYCKSMSRIQSKEVCTHCQLSEVASGSHILIIPLNLPGLLRMECHAC